MKKTIFVLALAFTSVLSSCKKDQQAGIDYETQTALDNSLADGVFNDVNNIANQAITGTLSTYRSSNPDENSTIFSACATVTLTPDSSGPGGNVIVDFGTSPCRCRDLRYRKGQVLIRYTGAYSDSGTVITTTFNNYYVGMDSQSLYKVEGTKTVTNLGRNTAGNKHFSVNVSNARITNTSNQVLTWNSTREREWIAGESTPVNWNDDTYSITGSASGSNFAGTNFTVNITSPLIFSLDCSYIKQGRFDLTPAGKPTRTLDYGNGGCDALATVTINGRTFNIVLR